MMDSQIVQVVAGESHTLALTGDGRVFAWGKGLFGRLGNGADTDQYTPAKVGFPSHAEAHDHEPACPPIVAVAAGAFHNLALADDGVVWSWGYNNYCQLGYEGFDQAVPHPLGDWGCCKNVISEQEAKHVGVGGRDETSKLSKVKFVEAGGMMSCAVDQNGVLWMWGRCRFFTNEGSKPSFLVSDFRVPEPIACLQGLHVTKVACGNEHILALVDNHSAVKRVCYAWGSNRYGQLGLGDQEGRAVPQLVEALDEKNVGHLNGIACGAYHSAVLTDNEKVAEVASLKRVTMCWTFGMGENGQLGHGDSESLALPQMVEGLPKDEQIMAVSCGLFHMGAVCEGGGVWIWGMERGLGLCPGLGPPGVGGGDYLLPVKVTGSDAFAASHGKGLACGAAHTVLATKENNECVLWAWGRGQSGLLGTGKTVDSVIPCQVIWPPCDKATFGMSEEDARHDFPDWTPFNHASKSSTLESLGEGPSDEMLALAQKEIYALKTELSVTKRHYASLHAALYGPSASSGASNVWEALNEWDRRVTESSYEELVRLDDFYRQTRARIKEVLLQRKVKKYCEQFMQASKGEGKDMMDQFI